MKTAISLIMALGSLLGSCNQTTAPPKRPPVEVIAFCGVDPHDPYALQKAKTMATKAGVDATMGPCLRPQIPGYTAAFPGQRYADRDTYAWLVDINAAAGMKTYVYDPALWTDPAEALAFWQSRILWIAGWDMGDEFQEEWQILRDRWSIVVDNVSSVTGVYPFTNNFSWMAEQSISDFGQTSFDVYDVAAAIAVAEQLAPLTDKLTCAFNTLDHADYHPTASGVTWTMKALVNAGCDRLLAFGGEMPINTDGFTKPSLVTWNGKATPLANAVLKGAQR